MTDHPSPLRLRFETVGSITAIVVGMAALWVSWDQGRVMRQSMAASVWPALQVQGFVDTNGGGLSVGLTVENAGVGPALIERITVREGGELVVDIDDLASRVSNEAALSFDTAAGRILAPGAKFSPFAFQIDDAQSFLQTEEEVTPLMATGLLTTGWTAEVCYCSSLGRCWTADTTTNPPAEVERCDAEPASAL